jgi:hypothetical protein
MNVAFDAFKRRKRPQYLRPEQGLKIFGTCILRRGSFAEERDQQTLAGVGRGDGVPPLCDRA